MKQVLIWPAFMDGDLPRSLGRRLPRKLCVRSPKIEEMLEAAVKAGLKARIVKKSFPRRWQVEKKALVLDDKVTRAEAIKRISEEIRRSRSD